jgi:hypothetical protein
MWVVSFTPPVALTTGKEAPVLFGYDAGQGPRAGLDAVGMKTTLQYQESNPGRLAHSSSLYQLSYSDSFSN